MTAGAYTWGVPRAVEGTTFEVVTGAEHVAGQASPLVVLIAGGVDVGDPMTAGQALALARALVAAAT